MPDRLYTKLTPARRTAAFGVFSVTHGKLWLGPDHLLYVETEGYTEKYRRFYFRDIQALTFVRTNRALVLGVITGVLAALFSLSAGLTNDEAGRWVLGIVAFVCAVPFVMNLIYGPTCKCELRTAVQTEKLPSMSRVRRARWVLERIRPLIAEAQGQLTPEEVEARLRESFATSAAEPPVMAAPEPEPANPGSPQPT